ncbi:unnamed protein product, partial [Onchocerca ochengi]|uniref:G_PROTEIN_RECEP_F1_2 domain-containing protein n=1 Tax=Onchocerca ochengi TaxID=42157 RepID=A0A182EYA7_ONCOC
MTASDSNWGILANWSRFGTNLVFPYINCVLHGMLLLLRAYTVRLTALSDASTKTCISETCMH